MRPRGLQRFQRLLHVAQVEADQTARQLNRRDAASAVINVKTRNPPGPAAAPASGDSKNPAPPAPLSGPLVMEVGGDYGLHNERDVYGSFGKVFRERERVGSPEAATASHTTLITVAAEPWRRISRSARSADSSSAVNLGVNVVSTRRFAPYPVRRPPGP